MNANETRAKDTLAIVVPRLREARTQAAEDVAARDAAIVILLREGWSEREVASLAGVTGVRVHQIKEEAGL